jgi:uncharacterized protein involved in exopolysaccharide biosynthesis
VGWRCRATQQVAARRQKELLTFFLACPKSKGDPMQNREIVQNIDTTLDQLIRNAEVISEVELKDLSDTELDAFQKTQESLLQHLLQMDQILAEKQKPQDKRSATLQIREKRQRFDHLKSQYSQTLQETLLERRLILSKRRGKRFFELLGRTKKELSS